MDLLLDVNIVIDICQPRPAFASLALKALAKCHAEGGRMWIYTGSVQTLEYSLARGLTNQATSEGYKLPLPGAQRLSRRLIREFARDKHWLASLAHEGDVFESDDPEDEQLIRALDRFGTEKIWLLTRDALLQDKCPDAVSPETYLSMGAGKKNVNFIDLKIQQDTIRPVLERGIHRVLHHGQYIMGPEVGELEKRLAEYVGVNHCIACASGTDALLMALMAKGVGPGDAILTTPFTFIATAEVIALLGATPVFVDIAPKTFNIDPEKLELAVQAMKSNDPSIYPLTSDLRLPTSGLTPKGIVTVDLFGLPCDYDRINKIAQEHGLFVIEDAAQGLGGEYDGKKACALGEIGCASFFPAKPLGCYGDGGAVFTDDDGQAEAMRSIRVHGKGTHKYDNARIGLNARMDTLQAAILLAKFDIFPEEIELRQKVTQRYTERLSACATIYTPYVPDGYKSAWAQYSVLAESHEMKAAFQGRLKEDGIPTAVYYPKPLHLQSAFSYLGYRPGDFPVSEDCSRRIFSLPMHPYLAEKDIERICDILKKT